MSSTDYSFDTWLDTRLRDVPVPAGTLRRLREIPVAANADLDATVCDVPIPSGLHQKLHRIGQRRMRLARLGQMTATVSLVTAVAFSYLGAVLAFLLSAYRLPNAPPPRLRELETITQAFSAFGHTVGAEDQISLVTFRPFREDMRIPNREKNPDAVDPSHKAGRHPSLEGVANGEFVWSSPLAAGEPGGWHWYLARRRIQAPARRQCHPTHISGTEKPLARSVRPAKAGAPHGSGDETGPRARWKERWLVEGFPIARVETDSPERI